MLISRIVFVPIVVIATIIQKPLTIKDGCLFESLKNTSDVIDLRITTEILEFKGFLLFYKDKLPRQLNVQLNYEGKFLTIKFQGNDYDVNLQRNCNCISDSIKNFHFHINKTFIMVKCNGEICEELSVRPGRSIIEDHPFSYFKEYSIGLWLGNHEQYRNYKNEIIHPNSVQPHLVVYNLSLNGHVLLKNPKQPCKTNDKSQTSIHPNTKTYDNTNTVEKKENKTHTSHLSVWIVFSPSVAFIACVVIGIFLWNKRIRIPTAPRTDQSEPTIPVEEQALLTVPLISQNVNSEITSNSCNNVSSSTAETATHVQIGTEPEQKYSSQSNVTVLEVITSNSCNNVSSSTAETATHVQIGTEPEQKYSSQSNVTVLEVTIPMESKMSQEDQSEYIQMELLKSQAVQSDITSIRCTDTKQ